MCSNALAKHDKDQEASILRVAAATHLVHGLLLGDYVLRPWKTLLQPGVVDCKNEK